MSERHKALIPAGAWASGPKIGIGRREVGESLQQPDALREAQAVGVAVDQDAERVRVDDRVG